MLLLDTQKMHNDILVRLNLIQKPQKYLTKKLGVSRSTFWRLGNNKDITMQTFLKLLTWLDAEPNKYIKVLKDKKK